MRTLQKQLELWWNAPGERVQKGSVMRTSVLNSSCSSSPPWWGRPSCSSALSLLKCTPVFLILSTKTRAAPPAALQQVATARLPWKSCWRKDSSMLQGQEWEDSMRRRFRKSSPGPRGLAPVHRTMVPSHQPHHVSSRSCGYIRSHNIPSHKG